jgi:hypothetical protein
MLKKRLTVAKTTIFLTLALFAVIITEKPRASSGDTTPIASDEKTVKILLQKLIEQNERILAENQRLLQENQRHAADCDTPIDCLEQQVKDLQQQIGGLKKTIQAQQQQIGALETRVTGLVGRVFFLDKPGFVKISSSKNELKVDIEPPKGVPGNAIAIIASVMTYHDGTGGKADHVNHSFGRKPEHDSYSWSNKPFESNKPFNDVLITHQGETAGNKNFWYGHHHGTQIIPLKSNGLFDIHTNMGYTFGTHYITLQVYGYIL